MHRQGSVKNRRATIGRPSTPQPHVSVRRYTEAMRDILFILITVGAFAIAALFVRACVQIVGADSTEPGER